MIKNSFNTIKTFTLYSWILLQWVLTTYGTCAVAYLYFRRRGAKKAAAAASEDTSGSSSSCEQLK